MCAGVTKETCTGIFISKKMRFYEAAQNFLKQFFHVNLLITIVYYKYIDLYIMYYSHFIGHLLSRYRRISDCLYSIVYGQAGRYASYRPA